MKNKIEKVISKYSSKILDSENIFVVDFKNINGGAIECFCEKPDVGAVYIHNPNNIESCFVLFEDDCLEVSVGECSKQCECIAFPTEEHPKSWILCIETKYSFSHENAFRKENNYPYIMIEKIKETVAYFRDRGVIDEKRRVTGIVSFPTLIDDFSESFKPEGESIEDILIEHNILIRPTNNLKIKGVKKLAFE